MKQGQNLTTLKPGLGKGVFSPTLLIPIHAQKRLDFTICYEVWFF